jgi:hypothetical protein
VSDHELTGALRALGARLEADETPDLVPSVLAALPVRPGRVRLPARRLVLILVVLLVAAATAVAASDTIRGWFASRGVRLDRVATLPPVSTLQGPSDLGLGRPISAAEAARVLGVPLPESSRLGPPDGVYESAGPLVTQRWRARPGLPGAPALPGTGALLTIGPIRDAEQPFLIAKELSPQTHVDFPQLPDGTQAAFIGGAPHAVQFEGTTTRFRLAANVLIWEARGHVYRLETTLPEADMLRIAAGFR